EIPNPIKQIPLGLSQSFNVCLETRIAEQRACERSRQLRRNGCSGIARYVADKIGRERCRYLPNVTNQPFHPNAGCSLNLARFVKMVVMDDRVVVRTRSRPNRIISAAARREYRCKMISLQRQRQGRQI